MGFTQVTLKWASFHIMIEICGVIRTQVNPFIGQIQQCLTMKNLQKIFG